MSWYVSRRQWFNRITNDSGHKLRFLTKPNSDTDANKSQSSSTTGPTGAKKKGASKVEKGGSSTETRKTDSVSKASDTTPSRQYSTSKRKVTFSDDVQEGLSSKKSKPRGTSVEPKKKGEEKKQGRKSSVAVTQDNFI